MLHECPLMLKMAFLKQKYPNLISYEDITTLKMAFLKQKYPNLTPYEGSLTLKLPILKQKSTFHLSH